MGSPVRESPDDAARCPCGSGDVFGDCCGPLLGGSAAPTAERLMRSRYTAFALGRADHLRRTWHPRTRPDALDIDADLHWRRLVILATARGGPFDREGVVEFAAHWRRGDARGVLHERSRFVRESHGWVYEDGDVDD